jgi:transmembrane 9 superfamily member 2/4
VYNDVAVQTSPYEIKTKVSKACAVLCKRDLTDKDMKEFRHLIDGSYRVHMMLDNLPAAAAHGR